MTLIQPELLKKLIQHDPSVTFAVKMLTSRWSDVIAKYGSQTKINASTVMTAKELVRAGLFKHRLNFHDYGMVKKYLLHNDVYMSASGRQELLKPFRE